jgi:hypothetical protein
MTKNARQALKSILEAAELQMMTTLFEDELNLGDASLTEEEVDDIADKLADIATAMHEAAK